MIFRPELVRAIVAGAERRCEACGAVLVRKSFASGMESPSRFASRNACGRPCADRTRRAKARLEVPPDVLVALRPSGIPAGAVGIPVYAAGDRLVACALVDAEDGDYALSHRWHGTRSGKGERPGIYARRCDPGGHVLMHRELLGLGAGDALHVDHRNGDPLDNRRPNLRPCTPALNQQNRRGAAGQSRSGVRGVHWNAKNGRWQAVVHLDGRPHYLGLHDTVESAEAVVSSFRAQHMAFSEMDAAR